MIPLPGKTIAVLKGGPGSERVVSEKTAEGVAQALRELGANVVLVDVTGPDFVLPDNVFIAVNMIHGTFGEDGQLQALLEARGIRYTGAGVAKSRTAFDKNLSKDCFIAAGVPTPRSQIFKLDGSDTLKLELPVVVKPPREGSSVGVHICHTSDEFEAAVIDERRFGDATLVEEYIEGKELTVGILGDQVLPIVHILPAEGFYSMENKYPWLTGSGKSNYECPAQLDADTTARVQAAAMAAFKSVGVEVYGRVDVMLRARDNAPFVLEINTIPGMTPTSLLPKAANAAGVSYNELCARIIELSLQARP
jgi:D-alanine-D-alanine ligase